MIFDKIRSLFGGESEEETDDSEGRYICLCHETAHGSKEELDKHLRNSDRTTRRRST